MHSFSQKCQSDQQRQEADEYQSVFEFFLFYLLECAHILCKIAALFSYLMNSRLRRLSSFH